MRRNRDKYQKFYNLLRETREARGITQKDLATLMDVPQSFISKLESGERRTDIIELLAILEILKMSPDKFIKDLVSATKSRKFP